MRNTVLALVFAVFLIPSVADAHRMKVFASGVGNTVDGYGYFAGGGHPGGSQVTLETVNGEVLQTLTTNEKGEFKFTVTTRQDYVVKIDSKDGHVASFKVLAEELGDDLPEPNAANPEPQPTEPHASTAAPQQVASAVNKAELANLIEHAVAKQVRPLRQQLDEYEAKVRLHDILGGIGWIVGLFGLAGWWLSRKKTA